MKVTGKANEFAHVASLPDRIYATWPEFEEADNDGCLDAVWKDPVRWLVATGRKRTVGVYKLVDVIELNDLPK
jgi:hypothetical protein